MASWQILSQSDQENNQEKVFWKFHKDACAREYSKRMRDASLYEFVKSSPKAILVLREQLKLQRSALVEYNKECWQMAERSGGGKSFS